MEQAKIFFLAVILITAVPLSGHAGVIPGSGCSTVIPDPTGNLSPEPITVPIPVSSPDEHLNDYPLDGFLTTLPDSTSRKDTSRVFEEVSPFDVMPEGPSSKLSAGALRESVEILCDPIFAGRGTGTDGARYASEWIRDMFEDAGLMPYEENWYHEFKVGSEKGRNVVGYLPGNSGKWILVGAYYDGLGVIGGKVYPGADSNASGVAALIAVANAVRRDCRDGLIFVAFDARSRDYSGARHMLSELRASGHSVRMMISLDILGSTLAPVSQRNPRSLMALGGKPWSSSLRKCAAIGQVDIYFDYYKSENFTNLFYNKIGDQTVFMKAGIPSIVFTSGITLNTNKVTDTPETLDYESLRARVLCISRWLSLTASPKR
ncbi:MAG: M28 family peptidase [Bacteroidales bacterium]|nr:M28 family peptidase [Bacteroidales bacterium]